MTMIPTNESISMILKLLDEKKEGEEEGETLVKQFLSELREHGVKIRDDDKERTGNHYRLDYRTVSIEVSLHGATKKWWSAGVNFINTVGKWGGHWGVVFLTPNKRFWVNGCNFFRIAGDKTEKGRYHVQLVNLERSPSSAKRFSSVSEFLRISGLSDVP